MTNKVHCDICDAVDATHRQYPYARTPDGAGSSSTDYVHKDLCWVCETFVLRGFIARKIKDKKPVDSWDLGKALKSEWVIIRENVLTARSQEGYIV